MGVFYGNPPLIDYYILLRSLQTTFRRLRRQHSTANVYKEERVNERTAGEQLEYHDKPVP